MAIGLFRQPKLGLKIDDREYRPGDVVGATITIDPMRDNLKIREGLVELVSEVRYTWSGVVNRFERGSMTRGGVPVMAVSVPVQVVEDRVETHRNDSKIFLTEASLAPRHAVYQVSLKIDEEPPDRWKRGTYEYRVVVHLDVVRGRNPRKVQKVRVTLK